MDVNSKIIIFISQAAMKGRTASIGFPRRQHAEARPHIKARTKASALATTLWVEQDRKGSKPLNSKIIILKSACIGAGQMGSYANGVGRI